MTFVPWLQAILWASFYASALALAVLILQKVLRRVLSARWSMVLWGIVLLRFVPLPLPESRLSLFPWLAHTTAHTPSQPQVEASSGVPVSESPAVAAVAVDLSPKIGDASEKQERPVVVAVTPRTPASARNSIPLTTIVFLGGAAIVAVRLLLATLSLRRIVRRAVPVEDPALLQLLESTRRAMGVVRAVPLMATTALTSPAVVGFFKPRLLAPAAILEELSAEELRLVFMHETAHIRRRDVLLNYALAALEMMHWFNPLVWVLVPRIRAEREVACDELVLQHVTEPAPYGHILLKLLQTAGPVRSLAPAVGIVENKKTFKRRIRMIAAFRKRSTWYLAPVALAVAVAAASLFTGPAGRANGDSSAPVPAGAPSPTPTAQPTLVEPESSKVLIAPAAPRPAAPSSARTTSRSTTRAKTMEEKLASPTSIYESSEQLTSFLESLSATTGINVSVNWRALKPLGVQESTVVTASFANVPGRRILQSVLDNAAGGSGLIDFFAADNVVTISTTADIANMKKSQGEKNKLAAAGEPPSVLHLSTSSPQTDRLSTTPFSVQFASSPDMGSNPSALGQVSAAVKPILSLIDHQMNNAAHLLETEMSIAEKAAQAGAAANNNLPTLPAAAPAPPEPVSLKVYNVHDILDVPPTQATVLTADQQSALRDLVASLQTLVNDSNATISAVNGTVLVKAPDSVQKQVSEVLDQLTMAHQLRSDYVKTHTQK